MTHTITRYFLCGISLALLTHTNLFSEVEIRKEFLPLFAPLPEKVESADNPITPEKVDLGRKLYYETRLSKNQDLSCNTCHQLDKYGVDGEPTSPGINAQRGGRNSPTTFNAAVHIAQFWDGRAKDVEEQAKGPILNPIEMGMPDETYVLKVLKSIPGYVESFTKAFPDDADPVNYDNMAKAIGAFERGLLTPSHWDDFLKGDQNALSVEEKKGFNTFVQNGCATCHNGAVFGGQLYQKLGLTKPWPELKDNGRFDVTKNESDRHYFKVPSLRNITETGPYLHDGSVKDLPQMVSMMAEHQMGKKLTDEEVASIMTFLKALKGRVDAEYTAKPELPPSGPDTPKPGNS